MTVISSEQTLLTMPAGWWPMGASGSIRLYGEHSYTYEALYRLQPNVRTCVDFLARNIAQLGLHVFRRVSDVDRERLTDHPLAQLIELPNPFTTRYRMIEALMSDLGIYSVAYWRKMEIGNRRAIVRIPPPYVEVMGGLLPTAYQATIGGRVYRWQPDEVVHFRGYNPENPINGLSPLETLRRILAEEDQAGRYREHFWANAARMQGIIERPREAPGWSDQARERFLADWEAYYSGEEASGKTAILEDGMTWKQASFSAQESEYLSGRKLTREECARAYHIPLTMVGILEHATFSNIKDQHKQLYQDCLGPWLKMIEEEIELQLLPWFEDTKNVYVEFNIAEKLAGSFEEQTASYQAAVGRPWMTPDEVRARQNLPSLGGDAEELGIPLNIMMSGGRGAGGGAGEQGAGQAKPPEAAPKSERKARSEEVIDPTLSELRQRHIEQWKRVLARHFERQRAAIVSALPRKAPPAIERIYDEERWNRELGADYYKMLTATSTVWARHMTELMGMPLDEPRMVNWLAETAGNSAKAINARTKELLIAALGAEVVREAVEHLFEVAMTTRAEELAISAVTTGANFGAHEGAKQSGLRRKTWKVNSSNPRPEHQAMNGETVGIEEVFSNGMRWPGDPAGGADNNANCQCSVVFGR